MFLVGPMSRIFDSYIIVDWSAASKPTTGADSIWIGALSPDARLNLKFQSANPETRAKAVEQIKAAIDRLLHRGDRVLLGFDFPLGYPAGTADFLKLKDEDKSAWQQMHAFLSASLKDKPDNSNNRFALAARMNRIMSENNFPFWGCPKKDVLTTLSDKKPRNHEKGDISEFRISEKRAASQKLGRPQPVWKLGYAGAVGGQAFTGIPVVSELKRYFAEKCAIWPMETGWVENADDLPPLIISEVYPSILKTEHQPGRVKDDIQVESLAKWFAESDSSREFLRRLARPEGLSDAESDAILEEEGWILGI